MFADMKKLPTFATATTKNTRFFQSGVAGSDEGSQAMPERKSEKVFVNLKF